MLEEVKNNAIGSVDYCLRTRGLKMKEVWAND